MKPLVGKIWRLLYKYMLIQADRQLNGLTGGDSKETISTRIGRMAYEDGGKPNKNRGYGLPLIIWTFLEKIDPGHCERAFNKRI